MGISFSEKVRLNKMSVYENDLLANGFSHIAGVDEAGRGPLAGPVVAASCLFSKELFIKDLNDSKQLKSAQREQIFEKLTTSSSVIYGVSVVEVGEIDRINILNASLLAMQQAVLQMRQKPDIVLIDGNRSFLSDCPTKCLVQGDTLSLSIAAASILAKVIRDRIMEKLDQTYPEYGFIKHKGYATDHHLKKLKEFGPCPIHRKSFAPVREAAGRIECEKNQPQ